MLEQEGYEQYLRLPHLLGSIAPRTSPAEEEVYASEWLFIVVHQSAEIILSQILLDLHAVERGHKEGWPDEKRMVRCLERATSLVSLLGNHLDVLKRDLPVDHFTAFRHRLGEASGSQSSQFSELFRLVGLGSDESSPLLAGADGNIEGSMVGAAAAALMSAVRAWQLQHIGLVQRMIGSSKGTGGTSGVSYLRARAVRLQSSSEGRTL
ncbi:tryptophan 2,3-dioxygenase family protein [Streptomyces sp. NPDC052077]|uniref:tryptophan 2,3-dioxygenase family protein n=1 Tax=Streptomyces sp. NPDC052077 TaxID=3154757 RepID=UPI003442F43B